MRPDINVILIVVDTLRKDYAEPLERGLKQLGFTIYDNAIAPAPWTVPSHASIFTGLYPISHGAHVTKHKRLSDYRIKPHIQPLMLQNILKKLGYTTYLFTANPYITPYFGYTNFDYVDEHDPSGRLVYSLKRPEIERFKQIRGRNKIETVLNLIRKREFRLLSKSLLKFISYRFWKYNPLLKHAYWKLTGWPKDKGIRRFIEKVKKLKIHSPFFMFMNLMEVHEPYSSKNQFMRDQEINIKNGTVDDKSVKFYKNQYKKHVKYVSEKIFELINIFIDKGLFENSLIMVTSDHGQLLGDHGRLGHWVFLFDELLKVPLAIKYPEDKELDLESPRLSLKYVSLTKIKPFILTLIKNDKFGDTLLYSDFVFAESYGLHLNLRRLTLTSYEEKM